MLTLILKHLSDSCIHSLASLLKNYIDCSNSLMIHFELLHVRFILHYTSWLIKIDNISKFTSTVSPKQKRRATLFVKQKNEVQPTRAIPQYAVFS